MPSIRLLTSLTVIAVTSAVFPPHEKVPQVRTVSVARSVHAFAYYRPDIAPRLALVTPLQLQETERVHVCEESDAGWAVDGPRYYGGLGWLQATWDTYRLPGFPASANLATPQQQARAMVRFVEVGNGGVWPDQDGCWKGGY